MWLFLPFWLCHMGWMFHFLLNWWKYVDNLESFYQIRVDHSEHQLILSFSMNELSSFLSCKSFSSFPYSCIPYFVMLWFTIFSSSMHFHLPTLQFRHHTILEWHVHILINHIVWFNYFFFQTFCHAPQHNHFWRNNWLCSSLFNNAFSSFTS